MYIMTGVLLFSSLAVQGIVSFPLSFSTKFLLCFALLRVLGHETIQQLESVTPTTRRSVLDNNESQVCDGLAQ